MEHADAVIIGAGLAGASVAWHLAGELKLVVLEQGPQAGAEASAQNAGMVRRMGEDPFERALALRTHAFLAEPGPEWAELAPSRRTGAVLALVADPSHLHDAAAHLRAAGVRVEACERPGEVAPALGEMRPAACWYLPDERIADAHSLVSGFLQGARDRGARVQLGRAALGLLVERGRIVGVATPFGAIATERVVLAAGAWSGELARRAGVHRPLTPLRRSLLQSGPHPLSRPDHPWTWVDDAGIYVRPEGGGWLCSPCDEAVDPPRPGPGSMGGLTALQRALAVDKLARHMPALGPMRFPTGWTGLRTFAPDRRPLLGEDPELGGLWWAAGLGGFGLSCCKGVGEAVASWMLGRATPWLHQPSVSPGRDMLRAWFIRPHGELHRPKLLRT